MARYSREFLVPYLQDICSLYLADRKLYQKMQQQQFQIEQYKREIYVDKPDKPKYEDASMGCIGTVAVIWSLIYLFMFVLSLFSSIPVWGIVIIFVGFLMGAIPAYLSWEHSRTAQLNNDRKTEQYEKEMADYIRNVRAAEEDRSRNLAMIPDIQERISGISCERNKVNQLIRLAYSANVIPSHYRSIYAAVYLYDWFSTSGADDLDMALNMFVLEEIKAKLDRIIEQQADMILNQRIMLANQEREIINQQESIDMQKQHHQMMLRKMDRLQSTEEERLRYEKMIESNTAATAYFAWANYLK